MESVTANKQIQVELDDIQIYKKWVLKRRDIVSTSYLENHIDIIAQNVGDLNKLKYYIPKESLYSLYCTLILP